MFPEAFAYDEQGEKERLDIVDDLTYLAECPVLAGFATERGTQEGYYSNPFYHPDYGADTIWKFIRNIRQPKRFILKRNMMRK